MYGLLLTYCCANTVIQSNYEHYCQNMLKLMERLQPLALESPFNMYVSRRVAKAIAVIPDSPNPKLMSLKPLLLISWLQHLQNCSKLTTSKHQAEQFKFQASTFVKTAQNKGILHSENPEAKKSLLVANAMLVNWPGPINMPTITVLKE